MQFTRYQVDLKIYCQTLHKSCIIYSYLLQIHIKGIASLYHIFACAKLIVVSNSSLLILTNVSNFSAIYL